MTDTVKRNLNEGMTDLSGGVGVRHRQSGIPAAWGGYLNICTTDRFSKKNDPLTDIRLTDLTEIGLATHWLDIAKTIGIDNFLAMWAILSNCDTVQDEKHYAYVPRYSTWLRYQRNRVIISLHTEGMEIPDIKTKIRIDLNETISTAHIQRIICKLL